MGEGPEQIFLKNDLYKAKKYMHKIIRGMQIKTAMRHPLTPVTRVSEYIEKREPLQHCW
jgi:hypothetical protein